MQFLPSDTSSHLQTIQTIENNHQVANHLYIKALQQKPDNLTILIVFLVTNLYQAIMEYTKQDKDVSEPRAIVVPMNPERSHSATGAMR